MALARRPGSATAPPLRASSTLAAGLEAFDEYMLRKGFSENTIKAFRNDLKIFTGFMESEARRIETRTNANQSWVTSSELKQRLAQRRSGENPTPPAND